MYSLHAVSASENNNTQRYIATSKRPKNSFHTTVMHTA